MSPKGGPTWEEEQMFWSGSKNKMDADLAPSQTLGKRPGLVLGEKKKRSQRRSRQTLLLRAPAHRAFTWGLGSANSMSHAPSWGIRIRVQPTWDILQGTGSSVNDKQDMRHIINVQYSNRWSILRRRKINENVFWHHQNLKN